MAINEEYQYSNYFLTREVCLQILNDMNTQKRIRLEREESETELDLLETTSSRILNWLVKTGWLKKIEDYTSLTTNIVIPDYAAIFIEAFEKLSSQELEETDLYIQNVYATLYSFQNNPKVNLNMLRTALVNTKKLNKALQDMLHNMDKFFERLLDKKTYGELLREHLDGYVEEVVRKKYHILKTSDNFYIYKMDIKKCLREMRENDEWIESVRAIAKAAGDEKEDVLEILRIKLVGVIPEDQSVLRASNQGEPVILDINADAGKAYADTVERLLGEERPFRFIEEEKKGFLKRLFGG